MANKASTLRDNPIWREANYITEYMYDNVLKSFPPGHDEKWNSERKIHNSANDIIFYVAQAVAGDNEDVADYDWKYAKKSLFGLQTIYIFAAKQDFIKLDPDMVIRIDKLIAEVDKRLEQSKLAAEQKTKKEMKPWLEKYQMWKEMQDNPID